MFEIGRILTKRKQVKITKIQQIFYFGRKLYYYLNKIFLYSVFANRLAFVIKLSLYNRFVKSTRRIFHTNLKVLLYIFILFSQTRLNCEYFNTFFFYPICV